MEGNDVVIIELDRPRELRLTHRALKRFCAKHHLGVAELEEAMKDFNLLSDLVYEMLHAEDPELTEDLCDELLDRVPISRTIMLAAQAIAAAFPAEENAAGNSAENPTRLAGSSVG